MGAKSQQIQIRVTPAEKLRLKRQAARGGQDLSTYVLSRLLPSQESRFAEIVGDLAINNDRRFRLAEFNDFLAALAPIEFREAVATADLHDLSPYLQNYVTAMVELAAHQKGVAPPCWAGDVEPLDEPHFVVPFTSLRPHLLTASPVPFRRRNIFVDASVGDRV